MKVTSTQIQMVYSEIRKNEAGAKNAKDLYQAARQVTGSVKYDRSNLHEKVQILKDIGDIIEKITALSEKHANESRQKMQQARLAMAGRA